MNEFRADLHCHTTCSDGTVSANDIVPLAIQKGLSGLSITDHDSIHAYPIALPIARELNFPLISGVEFSAVHKGESVHLLGYCFNLKHPIIHEFCLKHVRRRTQRNCSILEKLAKQGMPISNEEINTSPTVGRPHIALAMVQHGYVSSIQEAFNKFIGEGKPCYEEGGYFSVAETIEIIKQSGGVAIIAHPHLIQNEKLISDLIDLPFDGIEGWYGRFPPEKHEKWVKMGNEKNWLITGGSDFHGNIKPAQPLGCSWIGKDTFEILLERFKKNNELSAAY